MRVAILETGAPSAALAERFGDYPSMFERLLELGPLPSFQVNQGAWPKSVGDYDAYVVTGSPAGVYDPLPWIAELKSFLRAAKGQAALVGVCFGHQVMAEAFGGHVIKSPKGWGVGLHTYAVGERQDWMDAAPTFSLSASHQDQVVEPPPGATVVAGSDFCPNGMLAYGDEAISLQLHPEFAPDYSIALIAGRRGDRIPEDLAERAIESLRRPDDHEEVAGWIARFLTR